MSSTRVFDALINLCGTAFRSLEQKWNDFILDMDAESISGGLNHGQATLPNARNTIAQRSAAVLSSRAGARRMSRRHNSRSHSTNEQNEAIMFDELIKLTAGANEQDFRLLILNSLLRTPHREVAPFIPLFKYVHDRDPLFFAHLAVWYFDNGSVRDLKQLFVAFLSVSKFSEELRSAGLALLQKMAPYEVERVLAIIKGHQANGKRIAGISDSVPRSVKTTIEQYLRERENNKENFDKVVLHARKSLKTLYASLRIKPGEYAQQVLFDNAPPEDSRLYVLKLLAKTNDPTEQAKLIAEHDIPYRVAVSGLKNMTPSVLTALICAMTPQEIINNLSSLKKRGAMDNADLRKVIEAKLEDAQSDKRVSALKTRQAMKSANLDADMAKKVESVGDKQIKAKAKIKMPTALFVDKSGSMDVAIDVGKQIAAIIAPICESDLHVFAFDTMSYRLATKGGNELSDWERAFKGITAGGGTSCGVAVEAMRRQKNLVEQIIVVTDQEENNVPYMPSSLQQYAKELGVLPAVIIVNVGRHSQRLEDSLRKENISVDTFDFNGDYYSLPSLLPMLAGGTRLDFLMDIMDYPLPERKMKALAHA